MIVCLTAFDRDFLRSVGIKQDPWTISEFHSDAHRLTQRGTMPDTLEAAVNEVIRQEDERAWSDPEAAL